MRVGIVCEGATDTHAIMCFLGASLKSRGVNPIFVALQPEMDRTSPLGGWGLVLKWLELNPPIARTRTYFDGGLFDGGLSEKQCDVIVIQIDADNLSDEGFRNYITERFDIDLVEPNDPGDRGNAIRLVIETAGSFVELSEVDQYRHVVAPAVESTETWCVAAFRRLDDDPERLRHQDLCGEFMTALHRSEGRQDQEFVQIDKSPDRRLRFCRTHSVGFGRLEDQCRHYRNLVESLVRE